jgi:hypothetical protein
MVDGEWWTAIALPQSNAVNYLLHGRNSELAAPIALA